MALISLLQCASGAVSSGRAFPSLTFMPDATNLI